MGQDPDRQDSEHKGETRSFDPPRPLLGDNRNHAEKLCAKTDKNKPLSDTLLGDPDAGGRAGQGGMGGPAS